MEAPHTTRSRIERWDDLSRWERSEIGRDLRRLGLSYGEIQQHIDVKKSTLATWCRDVELTEEQKRSILERTGSRKGIPRDTQRKRHREIEAIQEVARGEVERLMTHPLWTSGVVLYWAEGNKTGSALGLTNSDPRAIRLFVLWCRTFHRRDAEFSFKLNLHADNDEFAAREWWIEQCNLHRPTFYKTFVKPDGTGHRKNHLVHGVCMARMKRSADDFHRTLAWIDELTLHFDRPGH